MKRQTPRKHGTAARPESTLTPGDSIQALRQIENVLSRVQPSKTDYRPSKHLMFEEGIRLIADIVEGALANEKQQ
jgi:hypothetical protein